MRRDDPPGPWRLAWRGMGRWRWLWLALLLVWLSQLLAAIAAA
ncbi:hypothetical protein [Luteimonas huabeiensis]|nr:hypothetical protein [Luteimonas huabeiensis]